MRWLLALAPLLALTALASASSSADTGPSPTPGRPTSEQRAKWRAELVELALALGWPGLDDFLLAIGYWESRFNPTLVNPEGGPNAARGWFGLRPNSALVGPLKGKDPNILLQPKVAVVAAADYAWRLGAPGWTDGVPRAFIDWDAVRRGWKLPRLVKDYANEDPGSQQAMANWATSQSAVDVDLSNVAAYPSGYKWPGIAWGLQRLGADS